MSALATVAFAMRAELAALPPSSVPTETVPLTRVARTIVPLTAVLLAAYTPSSRAPPAMSPPVAFQPRMVPSKSAAALSKNSLSPASPPPICSVESLSTASRPVATLSTPLSSEAALRAPSRPRTSAPGYPESGPRAGSPYSTKAVPVPAFHHADATRIICPSYTRASA